MRDALTLSDLIVFHQPLNLHPYSNNIKLEAHIMPYWKIILTRN
jgi:hypothetical protein